MSGSKIILDSQQFLNNVNFIKLGYYDPLLMNTQRDSVLYGIVLYCIKRIIGLLCRMNYKMHDTPNYSTGNKLFL